ncbi:MAG TPA: hypothetical protein VMV92_16115 [Streptosporangiaceae bacterium]|nr:hypothetical protein [Streptosporangiaceae bacterium]
MCHGLEGTAPHAGELVVQVAPRAGGQVGGEVVGDRAAERVQGPPAWLGLVLVAVAGLAEGVGEEHGDADADPPHGVAGDQPGGDAGDLAPLGVDLPAGVGDQLDGVAALSALIQ